MQLLHTISTIIGILAFATYLVIFIYCLVYLIRRFGK